MATETTNTTTNESTTKAAKAAKALGTGKRIAKGAGKAAKAAAGKAGAAKAPKAKGVRGQTKRGKVGGAANTTVDYAKRYAANYADVSKYGDNLGSKKIKVLVDNPKRGASRDRFDLYRSGMSVDTAIEKGVLRADIRFDLAHKYIALQ